MYLRNHNLWLSLTELMQEYTAVSLQSEESIHPSTSSATFLYVSFTLDWLPPPAREMGRQSAHLDITCGKASGLKPEI